MTVLMLDYIRLQGLWRQQRALQQAMLPLMPALVQQSGVLPPGTYSITVALTDDAHQQELNQKFRNMNAPTNVLSFPYFDRKALKKLKPQAEPWHLGDISLAYQYIIAEAALQGKKPLPHIIHLVLHGVLHILGYDHQTAKAAVMMEQLERDLLAMLKIADPYQPLPMATALPRAPRRA
jgi:probable rRNA maturation factor